MFECAESSFKAKPKQQKKKKKQKKTEKKRSNTRGEIIIHSTYYLFSDWPKTSSSCRLYNNHAKDAQGSRVIMACMTAVHDFYDDFLSMIWCLPSPEEAKT